MSAGLGGGTYYRRYSYDPLGNLTQVRTSYDQPHVTSHSVEATNRVSSVTSQLCGWTTQTVNYAWDAAGNLTNDGIFSYTYDAAGRQKEAGAVGQNTVGYDGDGMRVKKVENQGTPVYYVRSSVLKESVMEILGGSSASLYRAYVRAGTKVLAQQSSDGQFYSRKDSGKSVWKQLANALSRSRRRRAALPFAQRLSPTRDERRINAQEERDLTKSEAKT